jgi:hypothetical protein
MGMRNPAAKNPHFITIINFPPPHPLVSPA